MERTTKGNLITAATGEIQFEQVAKSIDAKTGQYVACQRCGCTLNQLPADACPVCKNPPQHCRPIEPPA
ncbi:MAG: hypothetical protein A3E25_16930 [Burkholderiales bacterium RIFCSPHIGHO2_12_FULL_69_20]|nr:MAG: hypothetical protein A3E25_16930 [Burkholderiales bacterium RIFCSPHIGHO2_12_FULL_69_20]